MKFKYSLGERILFKKQLDTSSESASEQVGQITMIKTETTKQGTTVWYLVNDSWSITDSDILGRITLLKSPAPRNRSKKKIQTPVQTDLSMTNGISNQLLSGM